MIQPELIIDENTTADEILSVNPSNIKWHQDVSWVQLPKGMKRPAGSIFPERPKFERARK